MGYARSTPSSGDPVRVITIDGEPWFVGKEIAEVLGYKDATNAMKQHCKGVVKHHPLQTNGGMQETRIINEPDMLRLIVGSQLPAAARFEAWVFEDVLPTIRKTGSYTVKRRKAEPTRRHVATRAPTGFKVESCHRPTPQPTTGRHVARRQHRPHAIT